MPKLITLIAENLGIVKNMETETNSNLTNQNHYLKTNQHINSLDQSFKIKELRIDQIYTKWEKYVLKNRSANIFSHPIWIKCLEKEYNRQALILVCLDIKSNIRGVLPLLPTLGIPFKLNNLVTSKRLSSLPRTPLGGILFDNEEIRKKLIHYAVKKVSESEKTCLQLKSYCSNLEVGVQGLKKFLWRNSFYLSLPDHPENIRFGNKQQRRKIKWAVNKARNSGIYLRELETAEDLKKWYKLYLETMKQHFVPPRRFRFFKDLFDNLASKGFVKLLLAEMDIGGEKTILAGSVFLLFNDTVFYSFNGRSKLGLSLHANDLIQWEAINQSCQMGYKFYDMGEVCENNTGLARFKNKWGCDSYPIYHYYFTSNESNYNQSLDIANNIHYPKLIWNNLPLNITRYMGTIVNRYL